MPSTNKPYVTAREAQPWHSLGPTGAEGINLILNWLPLRFGQDELTPLLSECTCLGLCTAFVAGGGLGGDAGAAGRDAGESRQGSRGQWAEIPGQWAEILGRACRDAGTAPGDAGGSSQG